MINSDINTFEDLKKEQLKVKALLEAKETDIQYRLKDVVSTNTLKNEVIKSVRKSQPTLGHVLKATVSTKLINTLGGIVIQRVTKIIK